MAQYNVDTELYTDRNNNLFNVVIPADSNGNITGISTNPMKVQNGLGDQTNDSWGTAKFVEDNSLFDGVFTYDIPATKWLIYEDNVEVANASSIRVSSVLGKAVVNSGIAPTNISVLASRRHPRYQPRNGIHFSGNFGLPSINSGGILKFGLGGDLENGLYFKTNGTGNLYACIMSNSVETHTEEIIMPFEVDLSQGNVFDIQAIPGGGKIKYHICNPNTGRFTLVHTICLLGTDNAFSVENAALSLFASAENVTEEVSIWCGWVAISSEGGQHTPRLQYSEYSVSGTTTTAAGSAFMAIRQPISINGAINTRDIFPKKFSLYSDKKSTIDVYTTRDQTAITAINWTPVRTGSFVEGTSSITAVNLAKLEHLITFNLPAVTTEEKLIPLDTEMIAIHGEIIVFILTTGANPTLDASIEWGEEV